MRMAVDLTKTRKDPRPVRIWYVLLMGFVSIMIAFGITITYIGYVSESRRIDTCRVINAQLAVYQEAPPSTPTGIKAKESWGRLKTSLHCIEVD